MTGTRSSPFWPSGSSPVVGVIGDPIAHSLSPLLHNAAFDAMGIDWVSVALPVPEGDARVALAGMRALGIRGLSVTMPHKEDAAGAVDELSPIAARLGAVNCVVLRERRLVGESTDGEGFLEALSRGQGFDPEGVSSLVFGAGGAARAVVLALADAGAKEVVVVGRTRAKAEAAAALAGKSGRVGTMDDVADAKLVVNATPFGMTHATPAEGDDPPFEVGGIPLPHEAIGSGQLFVDLVYHPATTPFTRAATTRGAEAANGLGMLVHQAALAIGIWTGLEVPVEAMWQAVRQSSPQALPQASKQASKQAST